MDNNTQLFNKTLLSLVNFIKIKFSDHDLVSGYETKLNIVLFATPDFPRSLFSKYISPYSEQIKRCDEKFFIEEFKNIFQSENFIEFDKIWNLPDNDIHTKARIFKYFITLLKLS